MKVAETTSALALYETVGRLAGPALGRAVMRRRLARGKEDPARVCERFGQATLPRPNGPLAWMHGASVGESVSLLPLIDGLRAERPDVAILLTTGTRTSAELMARRLPEGVLHQFAPIDAVGPVRAFLSHWRPALLCVVESEIWPVMLTETRRAGAAAVLASARISERAAKGWARAPRSIASLLGRFDRILAQTDAVAGRVVRLGASPDRVSAAGSLKAAAAPLPASAEALDGWGAALADRPRWIAASTHAGEETAAIAAHRAMAATRPGLVTVLAPRHPERCDAVAAEATAAGLRLARTSAGPSSADRAEIVLVDGLGQLGVWFRLCPVVFLGGSVAPIGGHNPLEPALLGAALVLGRHVETIVEACDALYAAGGLAWVAAPEALGGVVSDMLDAPDRAQAMGVAARSAAVAAGDGVLRRHLEALEPLLPRPVAASRTPLDATA